jgi:hypothetical protein
VQLLYPKYCNASITVADVILLCGVAVIIPVGQPWRARLVSVLILNLPSTVGTRTHDTCGSHAIAFSLSL